MFTWTAPSTSTLTIMTRAQPTTVTSARQHRRTLWIIFIIFVLGPCEPLIPLLLVPASEHSVGGIAAVAGVFAVATIGTMMVAVTLGRMGLRFVNFGFLEKYVHALSGGAILVSGLLIQVLGI